MCMQCIRLCKTVRVHTVRAAFHGLLAIAEYRMMSRHAPYM